MNWLEILDDQSPIRAIFGNEVPALVNINLHEVILHRDGPSALLRFDLEQYPKSPPEKWRLARFNRIQLKLLMIGIRDLSIVGFLSNCVTTLDIFDDVGLIRVRTLGDIVKIDIAADNLRVDSVSAYREE